MRACDLGLTVGWGIYCAVSWTWCIGMFLPVILIDRFGWPGFIAFAIPNISGVVLFGYAIRSRAKSEAFIVRHRPVMAWFSVVTIAYHLFFLSFVALILRENGAIGSTMAFLIAPAVAILGLMAAHGKHGGSFLIGVVFCYAISILIFTQIGLDKLALVPWSGLSPASQLWWLTPVLCMGFLLCPWFDLTFHRAVRESPSLHCFLFFAVAFSSMILLTAAYWHNVGWLGHVAFFHVAAQSAITMGLHAGEAWRSRAIQSHWHGLLAVFTMAAGLGLGWIILAAPNPRDGAWFFDANYVRFLVFYGLAFPAYAIAFMHPRIRVALTVRNLVIVAVIIALAAPFYELGFVQQRAWALSFPLLAAAIWIAARLCFQEQAVAE